MLGLFLWEVGTVFLDVCDFSVLLTVSILFFSEIGEVMHSYTKLGFDLPFFSIV